MNRRTFITTVIGIVTSAVCVWSKRESDFDTNGVQFDVWDNGERIPWKQWQKGNYPEFYAGDVVYYDGNVLKKWEG